MNPRIQPVTANITREVISEQTHLAYEPATGQVTVSFQYRPSLFEDEKFLSIAGDYATLPVALNDIATRTFGAGLHDPVTNADLSTVSAAGLMLIIKVAFATLYDAAVAAEAEHIAAYEAAKDAG